MIEIYILTPVFAVFACAFAARLRSAIRDGTALVDGVDYVRSTDRGFYWGTVAIWASFALLCATASAIGIYLIALSFISPGSF